MRNIILKDKEGHLCDTCLNHIATCKSNIVFGEGKGNDNVVECDGYNGPITSFMDIGKITSVRDSGSKKLKS